MITYETIERYIKAGLCIVPTHIGEKYPALSSWKKYQEVRPTEEELRDWFDEKCNRDGMGFICGKVSGGLEVIDFDKQGQEFPYWKQSVPADLYSRLVIETSISGGKHVYYKCENISGSQKLAMQDKENTLIETRGNKGFIKSAPSNGYTLEQGDFDSIPVITIEEREILLAAARCRNIYEERNEIVDIPATGEITPARQEGALRPGDDYCMRASFVDYLYKTGWKPYRRGTDDNELWTRPGKSDGSSGSFKQISGTDLFYVFTTNGGVQSEKAYTLFTFRAWQEFNGNFSECAKTLYKEGYGTRHYTKPLPETKTIRTANGENLELSLDKILENPNLRTPDTFNEFPLKELPLVCRAFISDMIGGLEQNPAGLAAFMLAQCGGVLGKSVQLRLDNKGWKTPPILWVCLIGVSGAGKSPALRATQMLVEKVSEKFNEDFEKLNSQYIKEYDEWVQSKKKNPNLPEPTAPKKRKIFLTDATFEGLVKDITISKCRTYFILDEFVTFFHMINRSKTPGESGKWLSGYNGASISTSRAGAKEVYINEAYWAMLGGSTPEKFRNYIMEDGGDKDGTLSRLSLVWAPVLSDFIEEEENEEIGKHIEEMRGVLETLVKSAPQRNKDGNIPDYTELFLSSEAREDWLQMRKENFYAVRNPANASDAISGYLAKSLELTPRIAIILHCIETAHQFNLNGVPCDDFVPGSITKDIEYFNFPSEISFETWKSARAIAEWFITENMICYELFKFTEPKSANIQASEILLTISKSDDGITLRDLYRIHRRFRSPKGKKELEEILQMLIDKEKIKTEEVRNEKGGRPKIVFKIV